MPPFRRPRAAAPTARRSPCAVEPLEARRLLAASPADPTPADGGPDQATAVYLGRVGEGRSTLRAVRGVVTPGEVQDVYRVKVDDPTDLTVTLSGLARSATTKLYLMAHGETRAAPATVARGATDYRLTARLLPGSWYVGVFNGDGDGPGRDRGYTLAASGNPTPVPTLSVAQARDALAFPLPPADGPGGIGGVSATVDAGRPTVHRIDLVDRRDVRLELADLGGDADVTLFDADGRIVARADGAGDGRTLSADGLAAGSYYASVAAVAGTGVPYRLRASATPAPPPTAPPVDAVLTRDAARSAYPLSGATAGDVALPGRVEGGAPAVYRVDLPRGGDVRAAIDGPSADADLALFDAAGRRLAASRLDGRNAERVVADVPAGSYFVHVQGRTTARVDYRLAVRADLDPPPPIQPALTAGGAASAYRVRSPDPDAPLRGTVAGGTPAVYRVDLARPGSLLADLTDLAGGGAELSIFDADGERIAGDDATNQFGTDVRASLQAGRHYVQVDARPDERIDFRLALDVELVPEPERGSTVVRGRIDADDADYAEAFPGRSQSSRLRRFDGFAFTAAADAMGIDGEVPIDFHFSGGETRVQLFRRGDAGDEPYARGVDFSSGGTGRLPSIHPGAFRDDARVFVDGRKGERFVVFFASADDGLDDFGDYTITFGPGLTDVRELTDGELPDD